MAKASYEWIFGLERFQRDCRLGLQIVGGKVSLAFDDAIDFKIGIAKVLDGGIPKELHGQIENWRATFLANQGGVAIEVRHAARPTQFLTLEARQMPLFSSGLQDFIDQAGQRG